MEKAPGYPVRRRQRVLGPVAAVILVLLLFPMAAGATASRVLVPVGGGYSAAALQGFSQVVIDHARGDEIRILVVPSSYGDSPAEREENIELALERTRQVEDACNTIVVESSFAGCDAELLLLFDRADAENPANSVAFDHPETDGAFILGGDQTIAMRVLADSPAEQNMREAYERGVVFGGASAGTAVESQTMIAGYTAPGWPYNALERPMIEVWWFDGEDDRQRGLLFGSETIIFDQHFYERGRMTRLLNAVAQSDEQYADQSRVGVGVDYATGVVLNNDSILSGVFGYTSTTIIDGESAGGTFSWVGERRTLSARNLLTHVMAQHPATQLHYDVIRRTPVIGGRDLKRVGDAGWGSGLLRAPGQGTLILGGDVSLDFTGAAVTEFLGRARMSGSRLVIVAAGYRNSGQASSDAQVYARGLRAAGWDRPASTIDIVAYAPGASAKLDPQQLDGAAGVLLIGGDQAELAPALADPRFVGLARSTLERAPVVMTDGAMTAAMGEWYVTNPDPTSDSYQGAGIDAFRSGNVTLARGLGILPGAAFEPRLTWDQRWGRMYSLSRAHSETIVFGISEMTALILERERSYVAGERSVVALDGRTAAFIEGANGAFSAFNVLMDIYAPGETVGAD